MASRIRAITASVTYYTELQMLELGSMIHAIAASVIYHAKLHKLQVFELGYLRSVKGCGPDKCGLFP